MSVVVEAHVTWVVDSPEQADDIRAHLELAPQPDSVDVFVDGEPV